MASLGVSVPLVAVLIGAAGCSAQQPPVSCGCDASGSCDVKAGNSTNYYLCDGSDAFKTCKQEIEKSQTCECLAMGPCNSTFVMLALNPQECRSACTAPSAIDDVCSNYDDNQNRCGYYAVKQCILSTPACSSWKPPTTECEAACNKKAQSKEDEDERLDFFLSCMSQSCLVGVDFFLRSGKQIVQV